MSNLQRSMAVPRGGSFEMEGLEGRRLLSFFFISSGGGLFIGGSSGSGGLVFSVGDGGHHNGGGHHHGGHHHTGIFITVNFNQTTLSPITDAAQTLFPVHFSALALPSFMPM